VDVGDGAAHDRESPNVTPLPRNSIGARTAFTFGAAAARQ